MNEKCDKTLRVRLVGADEDNGVVRFDDFRAFCENLARCLRKVESIVGTESAPIEYRVVGLKTASASVTLEALPPSNGRDCRDEVLSLFRHTVSDLQAGSTVDPRFDRDALEAFRGLVRPLRRSKEVWIEDSCLTSEYEATIERILGTSIPTDGAVSGLLESVNVHNRRQFVLYPPIPGHRIRCVFPEAMFDDVREAIKSNVTVWGTLYYQQDRAFPHMVHVTRMETHPPDRGLPTLRSLKGVAPDCTGGIESVDYVRSVRDE